MPRKPATAAPVESKADSAGSAVPETPAVIPPNENRSEEVMVVTAAAEEPVRFGGHILTEAGWVVEADLVPGEDTEAELELEPAPEQE